LLAEFFGLDRHGETIPGRGWRIKGLAIKLPDNAEDNIPETI
jgi:hypothetical protein